MIGFEKRWALTKIFMGLLAICLGVYLKIFHPHVDFVVATIRESVELKEGKFGYDLWENKDIFFHASVFDVTNPEEVMAGQFPELRERGPYVYNMNVRKHVTRTDEDKDELHFTTYRTYSFNEKESGGLTENDEITILNFAFLGTINTISNTFASLLKKLGNSISFLYPETYDIFLRGTVKDILWNGMPLICDKEEHPELSIICSVLKKQRPPNVKETNIENVYSYSLLNQQNATDQGPFTVNRGVKNKDQLGNTTSFKGQEYLKIWSDKSCNLVSGTDSITWPPLPQKLPFVTVFESATCRSMIASFKKEVTIHGLIGYHYELSPDTWNEENIQCYCPVGRKKIKQCLPAGLMDLNKCQEAPIIFSEPHFLNGDEKLKDYARGLNGDPELHTTYITIEPLSGAPLSGSKKFQFNMKLQSLSNVKILGNVSEGYFPIFWGEETSQPSVELVAPIIQAHRMVNIVTFFPWIPIVLGLFWVIKIICLFDQPQVNH